MGRRCELFATARASNFPKERGDFRTGFGNEKDLLRGISGFLNLRSGFDSRRGQCYNSLIKKDIHQIRRSHATSQWLPLCHRLGLLGIMSVECLQDVRIEKVLL
jgi:hypothetical protein